MTVNPQRSLDRERPRLVALVDSDQVAAWAATAVTETRNAGVADVVAILVSAAKATRPRPRIADRLFGLYRRVDARVFRVADPTERVDVATVVGPDRAGALEVVTSASELADRVAAARPDVVVILGDVDAEAAAVNAPLGVWSFSYGGPGGVGPGSVFRSVIARQPLVVCELAVHDSSGRRVLCRSVTSTDPHSLTRTLGRVHAKFPPMLVRALRDIAEDPTARSTPDVVPSSPPTLMPTPTGAPAVAAGAATVSRRVIAARVQDHLHRPQWVLAYSLREAAASRTEPDLDLSGYQVLTPPSGTSWADPFPVTHDGKSLLFVEEIPRDHARGHISVLELQPDGQWSQSAPVLRCSYHLSYPFIFRWAGNWYLLPETSERRRVELHRAVDFPHQWELDRVLLDDVDAVDATLALVAGRWWMFVNIGVDAVSTWDELHLFHASSPLGPWKPHRRNPVISDVRHARPAGRLWIAGGQLYRPAQDCSMRYGHSLVVSRVDRLDVEDYRETPVTVMRPDWTPGIVATHTINAAGPVSVVDALMPMPRRAPKSHRQGGPAPTRRA